MIIRELSEFEFNDFVQKFPFNSIYQTVEYGNIMGKEGYEKLFIGGIEGGKLVAATLLLVEKRKKYYYAYAPRGFLINYANNYQLTYFTKELQNYLGKKDIIAVKLCPIIIKNLINSEGMVVGTNNAFKSIFDNLSSLDYYHYGFNSYFEADKPRFEAILDLSKPINVLYNNIKREYKYKIRRAETRGIKIFRADINEIGYIYNQIKNKDKKSLAYIEGIFKEFKKSDKLDYYYAKLDTEINLKRIKIEYEEQEQLVSQLNKSLLQRSDSSDRNLAKKIEADKKLAVLKENLIEATNLIREFPTGLVLSTIIVIKQRGEVTIYMDAYDKNYSKYNSKHLLLWKIIEKYSRDGYKRLNLGGVTDPRVKSEKYSGLNQFKLNFNSSVIEYLGDLELVTNKTKYFLYKQLVKNDK